VLNKVAHLNNNETYKYEFKVKKIICYITSENQPAPASVKQSPAFFMRFFIKFWES